MTDPKACVIHKKISTKTKKFQSATQIVNNVDDDLDCRLLRFESAWNEIKDKAEAIQYDSVMSVLTELTSYLKDSSLSYQKRPNSMLEVPSAILVTGVNIPDHKVVYDTLKKLISELVTEMIVFISSNEASTFKTLMQKLVGTLVRIVNEDNDMSADRCTMQVLRTWYKDLDCENSYSSPSKRHKSGTQRKWKKKKFKQPIVIVFEDFESFQMKGIEDFIQILRHYIEELPVLLVFCISTFGATLSECLSQVSLSSLNMRTFSTQNPMKQLSTVLEEILLNEQCHYRLGSKTYKFLTDYFLFSDFSVKTFLAGYKLSMLQHFYSNFYSILCCDVDVVSDYLDSMPKSHVEKLRELCFSNAQATAAISKQKLKMLLQNEEYFRKHVLKCLTDLRMYHKRFFPVLRFFHTIAKNLPNLSFGSQLSQLYFLCLDKEVKYCDEFQDFIKLVKLMSREELNSRLIEGLRHLEPAEFGLKEAFDKLKAFMKELQAIGEDRYQDVSETVPGFKTEKKIDLTTLQKSLKEIGEAKKRKSPFDKLRCNIADYLEEFAGEMLKNYKNIALHEVYYYDNVKSLKSSFIGDFNSSIKKALGDPSFYIKCKCCVTEDNSRILPTYPDISIAYKLLLEGGRLVNLYDWLQSFVAAIDLKNSDKLNAKVRSKKTKDLIARFAQSVGELQYLGMIKKTARKTDHIARIFI
ncbi:Origin recognition complex subunit 3 [Chamberlinius hualienensis]